MSLNSYIGVCERKSVGIDHYNSGDRILRLRFKTDAEAIRHARLAIGDTEDNERIIVLHLKRGNPRVVGLVYRFHP